MSNKMPPDPFAEGAEYALKYGSEYRNPHPRNSDAYNQFDRGWSQAIKKYPEAIARIDKKRAQAAESQKEREKTKGAASAEAYRNRKGK